MPSLGSKVSIRESGLPSLADSPIPHLKLMGKLMDK